MEDSSWSGWTAPPLPPGPDLGYPDGYKITGAPPAGWVGEIRALPRATEEAIHYAARTWPQGQAESFDREGGRTYVERATGIVYVRVRGNPLFGEGDTDVADLFIVEGDSLVFLIRGDRSRTRSRSVGMIGGVGR